MSFYWSPTGNILKIRGSGGGLMGCDMPPPRHPKPGTPTKGLLWTTCFLANRVDVIKENRVDVKGNRVDVKGNRVNVIKGNRVNVIKGNRVDVIKENRVD
eukprot:422585-Prorocentrum_minimum.AAC.1